MSEIIMDEVLWCEDAIQHPYLSANPAETLGRIARYYYSKGFRRKQLSSRVEDYLSKCDVSINLVRWQGTVDECVKRADKYGLIQISDVPVYRGEMQAIAQLKGSMAQRLMFTLVCLARFANIANPKNNGWVNRDTRSIFKLANVQISISRQDLLLKSLKDAGYITFSRIVDNINMRVEILNDDDEIEMRVADFRNVGFQHSMHTGEAKFMVCSNCGMVIKRYCNAQKYCKTCSVDINIAKTTANRTDRKSA